MVEEKKEEVEQKEVCKLMPVVEMKDLPSNLEACTKDPNSLEPEAFGQLEHHYGKALNTSGCPCDSDKMFSECCKPIWRLAKSAWNEREDAEKKIRREAHKAELDARDQDKKEVAKAQVMATVLLMPNGQIGVEIPNDQMPMQQVASAMMEAYGKLILQMAGQQTMQILHQVMQQQAEQVQGQGNAPLAM